MGAFEQARTGDSTAEVIGPYLRARGVGVPDQSEIFQETSEQDAMPTELYVLQDPELLARIDNSLDHTSLGLASPLGSGKTALREITLREFGHRDEYILTYLGGGASETMRGIVVSVLEALLAAGYEYDKDSVGQVVDGVPWKTEDAVDALDEMAYEASVVDAKTVVVIADQCEKYDERQFEALQSVLDTGVRLLVLGTPRGRENVRQNHQALESRLSWIARDIKPFEAGHTVEYIAKSLANAAERATDVQEYDGEPLEDYLDSVSVDPFTAGAVREITAVADGNPRLVRLGCLMSLLYTADSWNTAHAEDVAKYPIDREAVESAAQEFEYVSGPDPVTES